MPDPLVVTNYHRTVQTDTTTIAATIGGFETWFRNPQLATAPERGDPFLAVALLEAMYTKADLDLRDMPPVSAALLDSLDAIQEIWSVWNRFLRPITVRANVAAPERPATSRTATLFSGGVDALHAVLAGGEPGEELVFINGFDFDMPAETREAAVARVSRLALFLGHPLEVVDTNWIRYTRHCRISRQTSHGGCLAAIAHLMSPAQMTIASTYAWNHQSPWGSHLLLDPKWSSDLTTIRHFGSDALRTDKVALIASRPGLLEHLWVCHTDPARNCGRCGKCVRTLAVLQLLGEPAPGFHTPVADPIRAYLKAAAKDRTEKAFLWEFAKLAAEAGDSAVLREVARIERSLARQGAIRSLYDLIVPKRLKRSVASQDLRPWGYGPNPALAS